MSTVRVVLYGRVSQDRKGRSKSVDQQLEEGRRWVLANNATIVGEFRDDGISASSYSRGKARPGWQAAMEQIATGMVDALWVWELSRSTRDRAVWAALAGSCTESGTGIVLNGKLNSLSDPDDAFSLDLTAALAVRESSMTSKRIRRDVEDRAMSGRPHGRIAYGYTREYDPTTGALVRQTPDPRVALAILDAAQRFVGGAALYTVARELTDRNVPRPHELRAERLGQPAPNQGAWTPNEVRRVISSPTAAGLRTHKGAVTATEAWEGIIPIELHHEIVAKLTDPSRRTCRDGSTKHLLSKLARCGVCGALVRRVKNRGTPSYSCSERHCISRKQETVDEFVIVAVLARIAADPDDLFAEDHGPKPNEALTEMREIQARLDGFRDDAADGTLSAESLNRIEARLQPKIDAARARATRAARSPMVSELATTLDPRARFDQLEVSLRREIVRTVCTPVLHQAGQGARKFNPNTISFVWN